MKKPSLVIGICLLVIAATAAVAEHSTIGAYDLWTVFNSGSSVDMTGGGVHLLDIKGYPLGFFSYGAFEIITGIGSLVGSVEGGGFTGPVGDTGKIKNTRIYRETLAVGSNLKLTWTYDTGVTSADIWRYVGNADVVAGDYSAAATWTKINTTAITATQYIDNTSGKSAVGDGKNAYFRIVPAGTLLANIFDLVNNTRTAGKIDVPFLAYGKRLLSIPLFAGPIDAALSGQVGMDMIEIYPQSESGGGLTSITFVNNALTGAPIILEPGKGMWMRNQNTNTHNITFVGTMETYNARTIMTKDLTGNTLPYPLTNTFLKAYDGDEIYPQSESGGGLTSSVYTGSHDGGHWVSSFTLKNSAGAWYRHGGNRYWIIDLKNGAIMVQSL